MHFSPFPCVLHSLPISFSLTLSPEYYLVKHTVVELFTMQIFHPVVTLCLLSPNILLSIVFSNDLNLLHFLNVRNQVSHPYKTTGKVLIAGVKM